MYHIIVFSFNRAMQCESVLRSILEHVKTPRLTLSVVWRATGEHVDGYASLRRLYEPKGVRFYEQSGHISFFRQVLPRLWMPRNLYHWLKYDYLRKADNFKPLLEQVIAETPADFVSFNTDDNIYYRDEVLPETAFRRIRNNPYCASYRVLVGSNLTASPAGLRRENEVFCWDYYDPAMHTCWAYPFAVDGTFYARTALLDVIHRVLYHNPVTLESYVNSYVAYHRLFRHGFSPLCSTEVGLPLNKVCRIVSNASGNINLGRLNELFLQGYELHYELPEAVEDRGIMPQRVLAVRGKERVALESLTGSG